MTIDEAIALAFNKNPEIVNWESIKPYVDVSPFAKKYKQLRNLAIRAVAAGILSDPVIPSDFKKWREPLKYETADLVADLLKEPEDDITRSASKTETEQELESDTAKALPPRALSGIAQIFELESDKSKNYEVWKKHAENASRNGLIKARTSKGSGSGESVFDPWQVGEWLVNKSRMPRDKVNRRLAANLEPGFEDMKDTYLS